MQGIKTETVSLLVKLFSSKKLRLYILSGIASVAVDYLFFCLAYFLLRIPVELAVPIGLVTGLSASFILNKTITFKQSSNPVKSKLPRQIILYLLLFVFNNIVTIHVINIGISLGISAAIGKVLATIMITLWNYLFYKNYIFR